MVTRNKQSSLLWFFCLTSGISFVHAEFFDNSASAIAERLAPIGSIKIDQSAPSLPQKNNSLSTNSAHLGKLIIHTYCILCHDRGVGGAPRLNTKADWVQRLHKKKSVLFDHVQHGYRAMPPKGACLECSKKDLQAALESMLQQVK